MKRRVLTAGAGLRIDVDACLRRRSRCRTMKETPMFADQVKSGALPPVDKRIPAAALGGQALRRRRRPGPAGRPAQHADGQRARYPPDDGLQLHPPDRLRRQVQAAARHPRKLRGQGRPRVHLQAARRAQMVRRPALHDRGFPLLLGRRRQQQGPLAGGPNGRAPGRRQAAQGRDHRPAHHQVHLGEAQPLLHREPGARRAALPLPAGPLPEEVPRQVHARGRDPEVRQGRPAELGARSTAAWT